MSDRTIIRPGGRKPKKPAAEPPAEQRSNRTATQSPSEPARQPTQDRRRQPPSAPSRPPRQPLPDRRSQAPSSSRQPLPERRRQAPSSSRQPLPDRRIQTPSSSRQPLPDRRTQSLSEPGRPAGQPRQDRRRQQVSDDQEITQNYLQPQSQQSHSSVPQPPRRKPSHSGEFEGFRFEASESAAINPVIHLTSPLLNVVGRLQNATSHPNMDEFKTYAVGEIAHYESQQFGLTEGDAGLVNYSSFALCCLIDELVLSTPWGISSNWDAESLLMRFHGESWGDEKFFDLLEEMMQRPGPNRIVLEFYAVCLELGFEGKYHNNGSRELAEHRGKLFNIIKELQADSDLSLSTTWQGLQDDRSRLIRFVPYWVMLTATAGSLLLVFMGFSYLISRYSDPLFRQLTSITSNTEVLSVQAGNLDRLRSLPLAMDPSARKSTLNYSPILRSALAREINMGLVELVDLSDRIIIRLKQVDLFRSGSDRLSSQHVPLIRQIGYVLQGINKRVMVTGHTDDVPVGNLKYGSNWDLSKARADSVKTILLANSDLGSRIRSRGLADTFNIVPNNSRENRARNRRVEIVVRK